jgi:hypothetical protein
MVFQCLRYIINTLSKNTQKILHSLQKMLNASNAGHCYFFT